MRLGTESRNKTIAAIGLMVLALVFTVSRFFPDSPASAKSPAPAAVVPMASRPPVARKTVSGKKVGISPVRSLDPTLRYDWLKASEDTQYQGAGRNIFRAEVEIPKPVAKVHVPTPVAVPQGPPPPPPINLKFFGFANKAGEAKKIFLSQGEDIFIAGEGDIVDRRYRILHITPMSVEVEDVLNNNRQSIPLTQG
ncbi:MAG TPA: hypothetical protein VK513_06160 [Terriglobales bacterium]|jgi:hypothetical protein|nr:hypothetical protein [Terriglobales bacterium]